MTIVGATHAYPPQGPHASRDAPWPAGIVPVAPGLGSSTGDLHAKVGWHRRLVKANGGSGGYCGESDLGCV
jgi:hypothetical protein